MRLEDREPDRRLRNSFGFCQTGFAAFLTLEFSPNRNAFACKMQDRSSILKEELDPGQRSHLRKIDPPEKQTGDQVADPDGDWRLADRFDRFEVALRAVRTAPGGNGFYSSFLDRHFRRLVCHHELRKIQPMLRPLKSSCLIEAVIQRR